MPTSLQNKISVFFIDLHEGSVRIFFLVSLLFGDVGDDSAIALSFLKAFSFTKKFKNLTV